MLNPPLVLLADAVWAALVVQELHASRGIEIASARNE
jgi:hypothetical protein